MPATPCGEGSEIWTRVWFDLSDSAWMLSWVPGTPTLDDARDRLGDILGALPRGITQLLDRRWDGERWQRRPLDEVPELLDTVRAELMEAALQTYVKRLAQMRAWWRSEHAGAHRADRVHDLAIRRRGRAERQAARALASYAAERARRAEARAAPNVTVDSIASRAKTRKRQRTDPGPFLSDKTIEEYSAEAEAECRLNPGRAPDLPDF